MPIADIYIYFNLILAEMLMGGVGGPCKFRLEENA